MIDTTNLKLQYEGSVKNVFTDKNDSNTLWFSFTDKYSVFDWGKMPDLIDNKGNALALIGSYLFQKLNDTSFWQKLPQSTHLKKFDAAYLQKRFTHPIFSGNNGLKEKGLPSHFLGLYEGVNKSNSWQNLKKLHSTTINNNNELWSKEINLKNQLLMHVLAAEVYWPELHSILNENLYFYPPLNKSSARHLIPLEVVFSFGLLEGSSLKRKLDDDPQYSNQLGLTSSPKVNQWFSQPTLQFFTKLEAKDRLLSWQEAAILANLTKQNFENLVELSLDTALALHALFAEHNLELWDGKLEFIFDSRSGQLLLADSIGPDEIRLLYKGIHLSKEVLRQYYRPSAWYKSLATARNIAARNGQEDWQQICRDELKQSPQPLPSELKQIVNQLYGVLANELIGETIFPAHPDLKEFITQLAKMLTGKRKNTLMLSLPAHPLKILVVGGGGREHALVWKLAQSPLIGKIFCAPGNGGTISENKTQNVNIPINEFAKLSQFCIDEKIDLTVVGPDNALAEGIVDYFTDKGLRIFGPTKQAARLEWSKTYAKEFMAKSKIPTAKFATYATYSEASQFIENNAWARVIKVDGLALGKGVYVCHDKEEAKKALQEIFKEKKFGQAGETVVLEEKLNGEEISLFLLCDGKHFLPLAASQDNKRRFEKDQGPNTGGMGAVCPPPIYEKYKNLIDKSIITPLMKGLQNEKINYQGLLYLGLLLHQNKDTNTIEPKVLEFNARFGDPETQAVLLCLKSDLLPALWACTEKKLDQIKLDWKDESSCCVVAVTKDYPEKSSTDEPISLPSKSANDNIVIFHAGTKLVNNTLITSGGRVLAVVALGKNLDQASALAYDFLSKISFTSIDYRKDIGRSASLRTN